MKKYLLLSLVTFLLIIIAGVVYWFFFFEPEKPPRYTRDPNAWTVPPVVYPMKGKTLVHPDDASTQVILDRVMPSTRYDYPMGVFTIGSTSGQLYAMDEFASALEAGVRAVPIVVSPAGSGRFVYLAVIEESEGSYRHRESIFLGDRIEITKVTREGNDVTVAYNVHAANQALTEIPTVQTSAIINLTDGTFVQEGRKPWLEVQTETKLFAGAYEWLKTVTADGQEIKPSKERVFMMFFDGPRVSLATDCNSGMSEYTPPTGTSTEMTFGTVAATKRFCESSEEGPYFKMIESIIGYEQTTAGGLRFTLSDGGTMEFIPERKELPTADAEVGS